MRWGIKFATRGRPLWFKKAIENILVTFKGNNFKILVTADTDDSSMNTLDIKKFCESARNLEIIYGYSGSKVAAINRGMEHMGEFDVLLNMSDDFVFVVQGWNKIIERKVRSVWGYSFDFYAHFNDGVVGDALATMSIMGREYYERFHYIYYPEYKSFSCDAESFYVAKALGKWHYFDDVLFLHQHPSNRPDPADATYRKNSLATPHDTALYWKRLNTNFGLNIQGPTPWDAWKGKQPKL